jgi:plasmid stabilization system protein ParE
MKVPVEESEFIPRDLQDIVQYLRLDDPALAPRFIARFKEPVEFIAEAPGIGRPRPQYGIEGLRSCPIQGFRKYLLFYEVLPDRIRLLRVLHGHRDLQAELGGR